MQSSLPSLCLLLIFILGFFSQTIHAQCPLVLEELESSPPPTQVTADFADDEFSMNFETPIVLQRQSTAISFGEDASNAVCSSPLVADGQNLSDCVELFSFSFVWANNWQACGWELTETDDAYTYTNNLFITHVDRFSPFGSRGGADVDRETVHIVPLRVTFDRNITLVTDVVVSAPVLILAAISAQEVDTDVPAARVEVTTNAIYPYFLNATNAILPAGISVVEDMTDRATNCPDVDGETCTQVFVLMVTDEESVCVVERDFAMILPIRCQPNGSGKCATEASDRAQIDLSIVTEDFCPVISANIEIFGTLQSFSDVTGTVKTYFLEEQTIVFEAVISSNEATITSTTLLSVTVTSADYGEVVMFNETTTANGFVDVPGVADNKHGFRFILSDTNFADGIPVDGTRQFSVTAEIEVTFEGVPSRKRIVMESLDRAKFPVASHFAMGASADSQESGASRVSLAGGVLMMLFLALA